MKKIFIGLLFGLLAFQVNAAPINLTSNNGAFVTGSEDLGFVTQGTSVSQTGTFTLVGGSNYSIEVDAAASPSAAFTNIVLDLNGTMFTSLPGTVTGLAAGVYNWTLSADVVNPGASVTVTSSAFGTPAVVPVPAAVWLFGSALMGLVGVTRRKSASVAA